MKQVAIQCKDTKSKWIKGNPVAFNTSKILAYCPIDRNICNIRLYHLKTRQK